MFNPPTLPARSACWSHFVYHLPEVIVRRNALLVKSQTGKCKVGGAGWGPGVVPTDVPTKKYMVLGPKFFC